MATCAITGVNWGDEGKGRMVDQMCIRDRDYNVYRILLEQLFYAPFKNLLASALLFRYRYGVNAGIMCPYKRICVLLAGYYQLEMAAFKFAFIAGVDEGLKICSPSGYQHGYIGLRCV